MKIKAFLLSFTLLALNLPLLADSGRQKIARTVGCPKRVILEAKEGERSLLAYLGKRKIILYPQGNYGYSSSSAITLIFDSFNRRDEKKTTHLKYITYGKASGRKDVLIITSGQKITRCYLKPI